MSDASMVYVPGDTSGRKNYNLELGEGGDYCWSAGVKYVKASWSGGRRSGQYIWSRTVRPQRRGGWGQQRRQEGDVTPIWSYRWKEPSRENNRKY